MTAPTNYASGDSHNRFSGLSQCVRWTTRKISAAAAAASALLMWEAGPFDGERGPAAAEAFRRVSSRVSSGLGSRCRLP